MESCLNEEYSYYKNLEDYKRDVIYTIKNMICKNERLSFASLAQKSHINPLVIRKYPELRSYMLQKIMYYKEVQAIDKKIDRVVRNLLKSKKRLTFMSIINRCKFSLDTVYNNDYIKTKVINIISENTKKMQLQQE